jgi:2-keto-4-pentenoate hydratase/2-oxohepta-3-ene-1,7-dioic acid hydratase in catechol pathway
VKLVTFSVPTSLGEFERVGALLDGLVVDLVAAYGALLAGGVGRADRRAAISAEAFIGSTMLDLLDGGSRAREAAQEAIGLATAEGADGRTGPRGERLSYRAPDVRLCAPVPRPRSLRDYSGYRSHMETYFRETGLPDVSVDLFRSRPMYYKANPSMVYGPEETVSWPSQSASLDFEIELALVIGRHGQDIPLEETDDYVAGYCVMNDFSLRDVQQTELSLPINLYGLSKSKDAGGYALGPCLVTPDEFDVAEALFLVRVNGDEVVRETTREMTWSFAEMIEFSSRDEALVPGDVLAGGAPPRGSGVEIGVQLVPGDEVECEITGIGILRNVIGSTRADDPKGVISSAESVMR